MIDGEGARTRGTCTLVCSGCSRVRSEDAARPWVYCVDGSWRCMDCTSGPPLALRIVAMPTPRTTAVAVAWQKQMQMRGPKSGATIADARVR